MTTLYAFGVIVLVVLVSAAFSVRVLREYGRAIVFPSAGCCPSRPRASWSCCRLRVDLRTVALTIPPQEVITRDNVPPRAACLLLRRDRSSGRCYPKPRPSRRPTSQIAQTTLRSVLGGADLDQLVAERSLDQIQSPR